MRNAFSTGLNKGLALTLAVLLELDSYLWLLMQELSRNQIQSIDYFLESRRLEKLQRMASSRGLIR